MSTTFDVFPSTSYIPTFEEILSLSEMKLLHFLATIGIDAKFQVGVEVHTQNPDNVVPTDVKTSAKLKKDNYAWFTVTSITGGIDGYFYDSEHQEYELLNEDKIEFIKTRPIKKLDEQLIKSCIDQAHWWSFRKSAGQPKIHRLLYGALASSFAELTNGCIFSSDSAWEDARFPALSSDFDAWYFRPNLAIDKQWADWTERYIGLIKTEFESI
jgi:hypothetical protein